MGSGGGGGGDRDGPQNFQAIRQRMTPRREERRLMQASEETGDQSYVTGGGSIVRDARGRGVLSSVGVQRAEESRQQELDTLVQQRIELAGGKGDPAQVKRDIAIRQLEKRKEQTLPGFLGAISRINIENQLKNLRAGGDPQFALTDSSNFSVRGVTPSGQDAPGSQPNIQPMFPTQQRDDKTPEVTPLVTPEIVPDDEDEVRQVRGRGPTARRSTRGTRVGGGGTFETGYGVLLRGPRVTAPSGSGRLT